MTVRLAELLMALVMMAFSGYLMWKSTELPIGWIPEEGPGGGFWPFWLSVVMLISSLWVLVNWVRRTSPPSRSLEAFFPKGVFKEVAAVALALIVTVALFNGVSFWLPLIGAVNIPGLGTYVALFFFLVFYVGFLGRHGWLATLVYSVVIPTVTFLFFEVAVKIILPKGITEPLFYPIFEWFGMGG